MPALSAAEIVRAVEDAFTESTAAALLVSEARAHPKRFYITAGESSFPVWIYIWTLTHGDGPARPKNEYRIQLTSATPSLPENPDGHTLLLGYEPDTGCRTDLHFKKYQTETPGKTN